LSGHPGDGFLYLEHNLVLLATFRDKHNLGMKRIKHLFIALLLLFSLAALSTGCTSSKVCQANKIGNHR
jgi:hypothetical protein